MSETQESLKSVGKRILRATVATAISTAISTQTDNAVWLSLIPAIQGVGKLLRVIFGLSWLPF